MEGESGFSLRPAALFLSLPRHDTSDVCVAGSFAENPTIASSSLRET